MNWNVTGLQAISAAPRPATRTTKLRGERLVVLYPQGDRVKFDTSADEAMHGTIIDCLVDDFYLVRGDDGRTRVVHADAIWPF
jgi:hypothetical protein